MLPKSKVVDFGSYSLRILDNGDHASEKLLVAGDTTAEICDAAKLMLRNISNPVVLDIGANLGAFTVKMATLLQNQDSLIYAFEQLCCTNRLRDSPHESSMVGGMDEQLVPYEVQDQEPAFVQHIAEAARFAIDLV